MKKFHPFIMLTLVLTLTTSRIYGQDAYQEEDSIAYMESCHTAHWSVYIPIAILVGAAIWFGIADQHHTEHDSSDSQDALGRIDSSKRISRHGYSGSSNSSNHSKRSSCSCSSRGSYSHQ